jgi:hypothetical protein
MQELNLLNDKVDVLLKKYAALQAENKRLKDAVGLKEDLIEAMSNKLASLEENVMATSMGTSVLNDKDREIVKKQLDTVLGEIDKILATLND